MACTVAMNDQGVHGGNEEQQQKMALLQALLKQRTDDPAGIFASSVNPMSRGVYGQGGGMPSPNIHLPFHSADQSLLQHQRAMGSMAFGASMGSTQQIPGMQASEDVMLLSRQLLQQQQLQLQQQQQLLFQAGGYAGAGFGAIGGNLMGGQASDPIFVPGLLGQSLAENRFSAPLPQQGGVHIQIPSSGNDLSSPTTSTLATTTIDAAPGGHQRRSESFPMTLHRLLMDLEIAGATHIATYVAAGDAFLIRNPKAFEERIVSKYFPRMGSFGSFQRQLNLYDFKRVSQGAHRGAYTHPLFRRQLSHLARQMKRTKIKGLRKNFKKSADEETQSTAIQKSGGEPNSSPSPSDVDEKL